MPTQEILRAVIFLHRLADTKDFTETVICIPDSRMKDLEAGLIERQDSGEINTVQIGRGRFDATPFTPYEDEVDKFFAKIDAIGPRSSEEEHRPPKSEVDGSNPSAGSRIKELEDGLAAFIDAVEESENGSSALDDEIHRARRILANNGGEQKLQEDVPEMSVWADDGGLSS